MPKLKLEDFGQCWGNQKARLMHLNIGFRPKTVLDIGAYHGDWGQLAKAVWPEAEVFMIEANEDCEPNLKETEIPYKIALLSDKAEEVDYHKCQTGCGEGNSLFKENSAHPFVSVKRPTFTLKDIVGDKTYHYIKMDCQGAEYKIITGSPEVIQRAQFVQLECQLFDYNDGAPHVNDLITLMDDLGFRIYDVCDYHHSGNGLLIQVDIIFARKNCPIFTIKTFA